MAKKATNDRENQENAKNNALMVVIFEEIVLVWGWQGNFGAT